MTTQLHNEGELALLAYLNSNTAEIGLYNDATDGLADGDGYSAITTEPAGASYSVQTANSPNSISLNGSSNGEAVYADETFDTSDSSQSVDAVYVREQSSGDLLFTCSLDSTYDLSNIDSFVVSNVGLNLD